MVRTVHELDVLHVHDANVDARCGCHGHSLVRARIAERQAGLL